ncbi:MAG: GNAT family N-acetyltransferase [Chloroflexota bacterium]|nr:GNAT family N-acetyltransferase [Chloroflexota bacterium]
MSIRSARAEDRDAVARFSEHTWEWGDYIPMVWEYWLSEPKGKLLVVTVDREPVGIAHVVMVAPGEAWLEGLRVAPEYRRAGLATKLTQRCLAEATKLGVSVVRFATAATNEPVRRIAARLGFVRVASMLTRQAEAGPDGSAGFKHPTLPDMHYLVDFLRDSPVLAAMGGLCNTGWRFQRLTPQMLKDRVNQGMVLMLGRPDNISALAITGTGYPGGLLVSFADGQPEALRTLVRGLRAEAAGYEPPQVTVWLPEMETMQQLFVEAGFEPLMESPLWVYEVGAKA